MRHSPDLAIRARTRWPNRQRILRARSDPAVVRDLQPSSEFASRVPSEVTGAGWQPPPRPGWRLGSPARAGARFRPAGSARRLGPRPDRWEYCWGWSKSTRFLRGFRGVHSGSQAECRRFDPDHPLCLPPMSQDDTGGFSLTNSADSASSGKGCRDGRIGANSPTMTGNDLGGRSLVQAVVQGVTGMRLRIRSMSRKLLRCQFFARPTSVVQRPTSRRTLVLVRQPRIR